MLSLAVRTVDCTIGCSRVTVAVTIPSAELVQGNAKSFVLAYAVENPETKAVLTEKPERDRL
jgi:hypothetical protein